MDSRYLPPILQVSVHELHHVSLLASRCAKIGIEKNAKIKTIKSNSGDSLEVDQVILEFE